jgi:glutathione S-transferase
MPELVLYHSSHSPGAIAVRLVLAEREIAWHGHVLDLMAKQNLEPGYLAINPKGLVPALVVDGRPIIEASVIYEFLEDLISERPLRPADPFDRARMRMWFKHIDAAVHAATGPIPFVVLGRPHWLALPDAERERLLAATPDRERAASQRRLYDRGLEAPEIDTALAVWATTFAMLEAELGEREWLIGDQLSLADLAVAAHMFMLDYMQIDDAFKAHPRVRDWYTRIRNRPSFAQAMDPFMPAMVRDYIAAAASQVAPVLNARLAEARARLRK